MATRPVRIVVTATDKASGALRGISSAIGGIGTIAAGILTAGAFQGIARQIGETTRALADMTTEAAGLANVATAFEGFNARIGVSADTTIAALRESSGGMIANRDLMLSYNRAAQLVSDDFAQTLPDAMQYLSRVSAATGEDMGFLMDSLVRGVGRLSPLILDNLGIQVSLTEAYDAYADSLGVATDSLTKQEQQMAVANAVMEALAANVGDLPDITDTAAGRFAAFQATIQNVRDTIGTAFIPVMEDVLDVFSDLTSRFLPPVVDFIESELVPAISNITDALAEGDFGAVFARMFRIEGTPAAEGLFDILADIERIIALIGNIVGQVDLPQIFPDIDLGNVINNINDFTDSLSDFLAQVQFIVGREDVSLLEAMLVTLGVPQSTIDAFEDLGAAISDFAAALFNFGDIDMITWEEFAENARNLTALALDQNLNNITEALDGLGIALEDSESGGQFWQNLVDSLQLGGDVLPQVTILITGVTSSLSALVKLMNDDMPGAVDTFSEGAETIRQIAEEHFPVLQENIDSLVESFYTDLFPAIVEILEPLRSLGGLFQALGEVGIATLNLEIALLLPLLMSFEEWLENIGDKIKEKVINPFLEWIGVINRDVTPSTQNLADKVLPGLQNAMSTIQGVIDGVSSRLRTLRDLLNNLSLPDWLTPGSPTPFELGLRGINDALAEINRVQLPRFDAGLSMAGLGNGQMAPVIAGAGAGRGIGGGGMVVVNINAPVMTLLDEDAVTEAITGPVLDIIDRNESYLS